MGRKRTIEDAEGKGGNAVKVLFHSQSGQEYLVRCEEEEVDKDKEKEKEKEKEKGKEENGGESKEEKADESQMMYVMKKGKRMRVTCKWLPAKNIPYGLVEDFRANVRRDNERLASMFREMNDSEIISFIDGNEDIQVLPSLVFQNVKTVPVSSSPMTTEQPSKEGPGCEIGIQTDKNPCGDFIKQEYYDVLKSKCELLEEENAKLKTQAKEFSRVAKNLRNELKKQEKKQKEGNPDSATNSPTDPSKEMPKEMPKDSPPPKPTPAKTSGWDIYDYLGVSPSVSNSELHSRIRKQCLFLHPDKRRGDSQSSEDKQLDDLYNVFIHIADYVKSNRDQYDLFMRQIQLNARVYPHVRPDTDWNKLKQYLDRPFLLQTEDPLGHLNFMTLAGFGRRPIYKEFVTKISPPDPKLDDPARYFQPMANTYNAASYYRAPYCKQPREESQWKPPQFSELNMFMNSME